jgi:hypothetical protein
LEDDLPELLLPEELLTFEAGLADLPDDDCAEELTELPDDLECEPDENDSFLLPWLLILLLFRAWSLTGYLLLIFWFEDETLRLPDLLVSE